jgi:hypothetical protein
LIGLLQPDNKAWLVTSRNKIQVPVPIDIKGLAMDEIVSRSGIEHDRFPIRSDKEAGLLAAVGYDIGSSIFCEIARDGGETGFTFLDQVLSPQGLRGMERGQYQAKNDRKPRMKWAKEDPREDEDE